MWCIPVRHPSQAARPYVLAQATTTGSWRDGPIGHVAFTVDSVGDFDVREGQDRYFLMVKLA